MRILHPLTEKTKLWGFNSLYRNCISHTVKSDLEGRSLRLEHLQPNSEDLQIKLLWKNLHITKIEIATYQCWLVLQLLLKYGNKYISDLNLYLIKTSLGKFKIDAFYAPITLSFIVFQIRSKVCPSLTYTILIPSETTYPCRLELQFWPLWRKKYIWKPTSYLIRASFRLFKCDAIYAAVTLSFTVL